MFNMHGDNITFYGCPARTLWLVAGHKIVIHFAVTVFMWQNKLSLSFS